MRWLTSIYLNDRSLPVPMLHREPAERSDAHDIGQSQNSQRTRQRGGGERSPSWHEDCSISAPVSSLRLETILQFVTWGKNLSTVQDLNSTSEDSMNARIHPDSSLCITTCLQFAGTAHLTHLVTHPKGHTITVA
ncbi:hypothetical protein BsWGS_13925 [Bradybaena similaris]